jgi:histone-binding protein RBBP4
MDYAIWRKNAPLLYAQLQTSALLWPSLALDWLPDASADTLTDTVFSSHRLVLSSFSNANNPIEALILAQTCTLEMDAEPCKTLGNFDYLPAHNEFVYSLPTPHLKNTKDLTLPNGTATTTTTTDGVQYVDLNGETDGDEKMVAVTTAAVRSTSTSTPTSTSSSPKVNNSIGLLQRIPHLGDVNRIKHCPQNPDLIATASNSGCVRVFDRTKKPNNFNDDDYSRINDIDTNDIEPADILLKYHTSESWTLDWNSHSTYTLATGSNDGSIAIWDLRAQFKAPPRKRFSTLDSKLKTPTCVLTTPQLNIPAHDYGVNEIKWMPDHHALLISVGEDGHCCVWDTRQSSASRNVIKLQAHRAIDAKNDPETGAALNAVDVNPRNTFLLTTGAASGALQTFDIRVPTTAAIPSHYNNSQHTDAISAVKYSPHTQHIASASMDGTVVIWKEGQTNAPALEPTFVHRGHLMAVNDVVWCPQRPITGPQGTLPMLASCSNDNSVHVWQPLLS